VFQRVQDFHPALLISRAYNLPISPSPDVSVILFIEGRSTNDADFDIWIWSYSHRQEAEAKLIAMIKISRLNIATVESREHLPALISRAGVRRDSHSREASFPMSSKSNRTVAIVGGGPVGALASLYFARYFDKVSLYELRAGAPAFS
jgi:alkyl hydroperoxide reductase subunit AhpF